MRFGHAAPVVTLSSSASPNEFLLQRWSVRWNAFVDVQRVSDIQDQDRLTCIPKPGLSPQVCSHV